MSDNKKDDVIDFDELDELPDVVLGDKTRAMRILRENGQVVEEKPHLPEANVNEALDQVNVYEQTTDVPHVEDLLKEEIKVSKENEIEKTITLDKNTNLDLVAKQSNDFEKTIVLKKDADLNLEVQKHKSIENTVVLEKENDLDLEGLKKGQKYRNGTKIDYLGNEVEIEDFNPNTSRYKIVDNGRTKWVTDKNLKLIDPEIPASLQDEDPGVEDELSEVLETKEEVITQEVDSKTAPNELTEVYDKEVEKSVPKHARTNKQPVVKTNPISFEELYKDEYVPHIETEEERALRMKKRKTTPKMQKIVTVILLFLLIILGIGVFTLYTGLQPVSSTSEEVQFMVEDGSTARDVANKLQEEGIIKNADVAYTYVRLNHLTDVKQGLFTLDKSWGIKQMFTYLNDQNAAKKDQVAVTIIEGDWAKDAAKKFEEVTNVTSDELLALWNNKDWIKSQQENYPFLTDEMFKDGVRIYLEGYLAPDTYYLNKETTAEEITTTLLNQTLAVFNKYKDQIEASDHSIAEIYTMASIIQYEAGTNPDDLAKVASVFYNRLNQGMMLQSSVTVCYAIDFDKQEDNWQTCEVNPDYESPYNTYKHTGLTPGPIENAGEAAILAAINPADTNYLYFMAEVCPGGDGTVHYAETLDEHNANVSKYLNCY